MRIQTSSKTVSTYRLVLTEDALPGFVPTIRVPEKANQDLVVDTIDISSVDGKLQPTCLASGPRVIEWEVAWADQPELVRVLQQAGLVDDTAGKAAPQS